MSGLVTSKDAGAKNPVGDAAVVADAWEETLKRIGGSQSDDWNHVLGNQAIQSLWIKQSDNEVRGRQYNAAIAGLIGIAPQDEIEGMIAAQLIAAHNATNGMLPARNLGGRCLLVLHAVKVAKIAKINSKDGKFINKSRGPSRNRPHGHH
jgi:hypothetical protein